MYLTHPDFPSFSSKKFSHPGSVLELPRHGIGKHRRSRHARSARPCRIQRRIRRQQIFQTPRAPAGFETACISPSGKRTDPGLRHGRCATTRTWPSTWKPPLLAFQAGMHLRLANPAFPLVKHPPDPAAKQQCLFRPGLQVGSGREILEPGLIGEHFIRLAPALGYRYFT